MWTSNLFLFLLLFRNIYSSIATENLEELNLCEQQLSRYQKSLLSAILSFEDICDLYETIYFNSNHDLLKNFNSHINSNTNLNFNSNIHKYNSFFALIKFLSENFNDNNEFLDIIRDAIIEKCYTKSFKSEKRDSVVIGKKQRFHSWGGKRSSKLQQNENYDSTNNIKHFILPSKSDNIQQYPWNE